MIYCVFGAVFGGAMGAALFGWQSGLMGFVGSLVCAYFMGLMED